MKTIQEIYKLIGDAKVITDSRAIEPGCIFLALKGPAFNGNDFAGKAIDSGAAFAIVDEKQALTDSRCILVEDGLSALQQLANYHRRQLSIPVLAITGSNGKTTTKELIRNVIAKKYKTVATKGNLNNHIGVPLTLLGIRKDDEFAIIEMGANHQKEIELLCEIAMPDYGLITNVGKAHLEGFGGVEGVKKGKGEMYDFLSKSGKGVFVNTGSASLKEMASARSFKNKITYGIADDNYCSGKLISSIPSLDIEWHCNGVSSRVKTSLIGEYNFENILSAICVGNYFGVNEKDINDAIFSYVPDNSRSQLVVKGTNTIILDAYNANPTSMEAALNNFQKSEGKKKFVFIGDMAELGDESRAEHKRIVDVLKKMDLAGIILVGKNFGEFTSELHCTHFSTSTEAAQWLKDHRPENATILIKGSRSSAMEKMSEVL